MTALIKSFPLKDGYNQTTLQEKKCLRIDFLCYYMIYDLGRQTSCESESESSYSQYRLFEREKNVQHPCRTKKSTEFIRIEFAQQISMKDIIIMVS